jgi:NAD(P)-dependent dehydrogenase (short-subunit alcohol dehydrogenase family)
LPAVQLILGALRRALGVSPGTIAGTWEDWPARALAGLSVNNAFLSALRRSAHPRIVSISSGTVSLIWSTHLNPQLNPGTGGAAAYRSSKATLNALTVFYAQTLADEGFKVNVLAPGLRAADLNAAAGAVR